MFNKSILYGVIGCMMLFGGCYTQFAMIDRSLSDDEPVMEHSTQDTCTTCDSMKSTSKNRVDTLVIKDQRRETCYWTRNFWGDPVLKCVNTFYSRDWMVYNDYPWWYSERPYYYDSRGRCPRYYYYDADCGRCRYYTDTDPYYLYPGYRGSGSYGTGSYGSGSGGAVDRSGTPSSASQHRPPSVQSRDGGTSHQIRRVDSAVTGKILQEQPAPSPVVPAQPAQPAQPVSQPVSPSVGQPASQPDSAGVIHIQPRRHGASRN